MLKQEHKNVKSHTVSQFLSKATKTEHHSITEALSNSIAKHLVF